MRAFADSLIDLFESIHPLDRVPRSGYLLRGVPDPESVAAHSHFVALMTLLFIGQYPGRFDPQRAVALALVHDLSEARILDIPMPYGDAYMKEAKHRAEQMILDELFAPLNPELASLHFEGIVGETAEARLVRALDKAQMMVKVLCYERERRGNLEEFWMNPANFNDFGIPEVSALFDAICARAGRQRPTPAARLEPTDD